MAKSITNIEKSVPNQADEDAQALEQVLKAVANQREALLGLFDILDELHKLGLLNIARGMLKNSKEIGVIGIQQMNKPGAHRMIKNGMAAAQFLSQVDPNKLQILLNGVAHGVDEAVDLDPGKKKTGWWEMLKSMREPGVRSSLAMMTKFLRGMGKGLRQNH